MMLHTCGYCTLIHPLKRHIIAYYILIHSLKMSVMKPNGEGHSLLLASSDTFLSNWYFLFKLEQWSKDMRRTEFTPTVSIFTGVTKMHTVHDLLGFCSSWYRSIVPTLVTQPYMMWVNSSHESLEVDYVTRAKQNTVNPWLYLWTAYVCVYRLSIDSFQFIKFIQKKKLGRITWTNPSTFQI